MLEKDTKEEMERLLMDIRRRAGSAAAKTSEVYMLQHQPAHHVSVMKSMTGILQSVTEALELLEERKAEDE